MFIIIFIVLFTANAVQRDMVKFKQIIIITKTLSFIPKDMGNKVVCVLNSEFQIEQIT